MDYENRISHTLPPLDAVYFHKEKRTNSVRDKLRRLETLESKLCVIPKNDKTNYSKQSTNLFDKNNSRTRQPRFDKYGAPIIKNGFHRVTFSEGFPEIKKYQNRNTVYQDRLHEVRIRDKIKREELLNKRRADCQCLCLIF
jgi:hypothetical protein